MNNLEKLNLLREKKSEACAGGGDEKIKMQHNAGKKTARERIAMLFDEGTFVETDSFLKCRNSLTGEDKYDDGVVAGYGTVDERLVYAYAQDYTVLNGSLGEMNAKKIKKIYSMAVKTGAPVISLIDCGGVRLDDGLDALCSYNSAIKSAVDASGIVPQISIVCGNCAGTMTFIPAVSDFTIMVNEISNLYLTSKEVLKAVNNEEDDKFPGALFNAENGVCDFVCVSEEEAVIKAKKLLSILPSNYLEDAIFDCLDDLNRASENIIDMIPSDDKTGYDMKDIIKTIADSYDFLEVKEEYAKNIITGFIKLGGITVGVVANQPLVDGGLLDNFSAKKAASFVGICDSFNIPILSLTDCEGIVNSLGHEKYTMVNDVAKLGYAFANANVAKVNIIVRKAYGSAYLYMNSKQMGADFSYAFPTAIITGVTPEVALNMLFEEEIAKADNPVERRKEILTMYKEEVASPYEAAKRGYIDDIIDPKDIRPILVSAFDVLLSKRENTNDKKHGNMPM